MKTAQVFKSEVRKLALSLSMGQKSKVPRPVLPIAVAAALLFSFTICHAQQPKEAVDAKAKGVLDEVAAKTKTYTSIKAEFSTKAEKQVTNTETKTSESESGILHLKGTKYKLEFKGQTIFCDSKTQWTYIKDGNEVQIDKAPDTKSAEINPVNIFTIYEKGFKYKYEKEEVVNGVKSDIINLYPTDPDKRSYHTIRLTIDKTQKQITAVKVVNKNGTSTTITVRSFITNEEMPDTLFIFNKTNYKGVTEIDLRDE